jgi:hypothetical protein
LPARPAGGLYDLPHPLTCRCRLHFRSLTVILWGGRLINNPCTGMDVRAMLFDGERGWRKGEKKGRHLYLHKNSLYFTAPEFKYRSPFPGMGGGKEKPDRILRQPFCEGRSQGKSWLCTPFKSIAFFYIESDDKVKTAFCE